jgi:hypothetical protein
LERAAPGAALFLCAKHVRQLGGDPFPGRAPRIVLCMDRDEAGLNGVRQALARLRGHSFEVSLFEWDWDLPGCVRDPEPIPVLIRDPADMTV